MKKMLQFDLARGRVPRLETVARIMDLLIPSGLSGVVFYLETSVVNAEFPAVGTGKTPVTQEYLKKVCALCEERKLEFLPHFEIFSHQENLLKLPEMKPYAETEGSSCFRMDLPDLREKIKRMIREVSSCFSSPYVHCGGDEGFLLGLYRSRPYCRQKGFENVFAEYVNDIDDFLRSIGKTMLLYADSPIVYPGLIQKLHSDIVMVNWAYCIRDEVYEVENYHYSRHENGVAGHRFWVTGNCMAEYVFTPFYRLEENVAIWRELGRKAERFVIADWGSHENTNPYTLTVLGALYALKSWENPQYSMTDYIGDVEKMVLKKHSAAFRKAYRILLNASGPKYWPRAVLHRGSPLPMFRFDKPESKGICVSCGMLNPDRLKQLECDVRSAVSLMDQIPDELAKEPEMLQDLKALSRRVLGTVLRAELCFRHAHDTGGIWFTEDELEPRRREYRECTELLKNDVSFVIGSWRRDSLESELDRAVRYCEQTIEDTAPALRLPENTLRVFPPIPGSNR